MNGAMRLIAAMAVAGVVNTAAGVEAVGNRTCSLWLAHMGRASNTSWTQIAAQQWLAGYLSGLAQGTGIDVLHGVDMEAVYASMDQYC